MTHEEIVTAIVTYLEETNAQAKKLGRLPLDQSLMRSGILDSFGIVELVSFIEQRWSIEILDTELTHEMFGGINNMARLVGKKLAS